MAILPFSAMCLLVKTACVYTIALYFMLNRLAFSTILHRILHQNTLHLAPKRTAFSTKTHRILLQNALYFAANSLETGANSLETGASGGLF